ncbi:Ubiquitin carboxyl-terminal hydrolase [Schizosaccharomyces pombe]|uniref:Probable ubiquitin carboxyl-terminal hydrolase 3 n=1 Tax=Schizosaccharomyces pombe (strain 972 / ATCC 24843) TaxID=284812 RepID=UBP3_SCHPO|nr:ubiquitin hydrolase Ubp3 [Schizosaccharomyces pombe]O94269.1 RecName: Full=Probable ubiquitin carboxyl-terminal hydrolase 3; AltName: Full=Deubiquitinating enzyme 3; AltName: Full=Ubiquitin thioesterase 3; AltName: Full=Ubiquitin-specific-processing protease 3 [Schizosaccharomyces pombe 972h-]CAA21806.1 ubiquitin C-terminal hydrolase Ubp3 [Schizosaccharomyces pombe]|eukprot:NP_596528.1 ubiquitin hydrolase Ubp3 [Schizosaccharomyces pombe]
MRDLTSATDSASLESDSSRNQFIINSLLPWYSCSEHEFPHRKARKRRSPKNLDWSVSVQMPLVTSKTKESEKSPKSWSAIAKKHVQGDSPVKKSHSVPVPSDRSEKKSFNSSLGELIETYSPSLDAPRPIQPRGFINTGNICFMNSILQALMYCVPFYNLLKQINRMVPYNFERTTPLIESLTMLSRDFREYSEKFDLQGDSILPEVVYSATKGNPRFEMLQTGEQEDAEEFLNLFLDELHEEFVRERRHYLLKNDERNPKSDIKISNGIKSGLDSFDDQSSVEASGWTEVGKNKKPVIARSATVERSPISQIFGGQLRSTLRVPSARDSVLLEPFQPLQLDIQAEDIHSVIDALEHMTAPEILPEWHSSKGNVTATKQMYIESLPPVLILHLKRFFYEASGGTQKNYKPIAYPARLSIPQNVFSPSVRGSIHPEYDLNAVVYHHGTSASGGHYTVDVQQLDKSGWFRIDDTHIHRVPIHDVENSELSADPSLSKLGHGDRVAYLLFYTRRS